MVFARYEQATIDGFSLDLAAIAEKWKFQTEATSFSVKEKKRRVKRINAIGDDAKIYKILCKENKKEFLVFD